MKLVIFLAIILTPICLSSQVVTVQYDSDNASSNFDQMNLGDEMKARMRKAYNGLLLHYTVIGDGNQVICSLDSLTQKCGEENSSIYPYKRIQTRGDDNNWLDYRMINGPSEPNKIYRILEGNADASWTIDFNSTKQILGFNCYQVVNESNKEKIAWVTMDIPLTLSPTDQFSFPGVVLEHFDGSTRFIAKNVTLDHEMKNLTKIDASSESIESCKNFRDFSEILMNTTQKISSNMFGCREE